MTVARIAITMDPRLLRKVDTLVRSRRYKSRNEAIRSILRTKLGQVDPNRLVRECAKRDLQND